MGWEAETSMFYRCRLTDGVTIDGDVEEGARDLLELNNTDADAAAEAVVDTVGVAVGGANGHGSRKRSSSGIGISRVDSIQNSPCL